MNKWTVMLSCFACLSVLMPTAVNAQYSKIGFGDLGITPSLGLKGMYDDNIYLVNGSDSEGEEKESDFITHLLPEVIFNYDLPDRGGLTIDYRGDLATYSSNSSNNWQTHQARLDLQYLAPIGLVGDFGLGYTDAEDPYGNIENFRIGQTTERTYKDVNLSVGYDFTNIFKVTLFYSRYIQDYALERDYTQDYEADEWGFGIQRRLLPKTWGVFRYLYGSRDYVTHPSGTGVSEANDSDFDWHAMYVGLTWDIGAKLNGEINLGYEWRSHQNSVDARGNRYKDKNTWISSTQVSFQATPTSAIALGVTRGLRQTGSDTNEYFEDTGIGINFRKLITTKYVLTTGMVYGINNYNLPKSEPREDNNFELGADLDYEIREWLTAGIGYKYQKNDSNYKRYSYTNNQFGISITARY
ncbi:MAG: outer membrane beta-barrel protein [Thermodesulfobacteriota bacterium]